MPLFTFCIIDKVYILTLAGYYTISNMRSLVHICGNEVTGAYMLSRGGHWGIHVFTRRSLVHTCFNEEVTGAYTLS